MTNGLKVPKHLKDPIDSLCLDLCDRVLPFFKSLDFTPNMLTGLGIIARISSFYFLFYRQSKLGFLIGQLIGYFFDVIDGYYARTYNMISKSGDLLDHLSDLANAVLLLFYLFRSETFRRNRYVWIYVIIMVAIALCAMSHQGCQEKMHNDTEMNQLLSVYRPLCPDIRMIEYTKYCGQGVILFYVLALVTLF